MRANLSPFSSTASAVRTFLILVALLAAATSLQALPPECALVCGPTEPCDQLCSYTTGLRVTFCEIYTNGHCSAGLTDTTADTTIDRIAPRAAANSLDSCDAEDPRETIDRLAPAPAAEAIPAPTTAESPAAAGD